MALTFAAIGSFNTSVVSVAETSLGAKITALNAKGDAVTSGDLLQVQTDLQKWTLTTNIQSTLTKELGDALKGIIQKAG
jgi:type III secretion protein F